jgi:RNA polymerase sigma-70 factor (ECF subfamily)
MASQPLSALVAGIAQGDQGSLAALYDQTSRLVFGLALQALPNAAAAEEVALEVYARVWRTASRYDGGVSVLTWLAATTRDLTREWTLTHPGRENRTMEQLPEALLAARKEVA